MSPERPTSPQDEAVFTPKMSAPGSPIAGTPVREAQSPISILLAVAQSQSKSPDDDLTSLTWLQNDLLKGMNINPSPSNSISSTPIKYLNNSFIVSEQSPTSDYVEDSSISTADSSGGSSVTSPTPYQNGTQRVKHPHNIPYDPLVHTNSKPPYSFSCLIFMAIEDSKQKALPVKEIYAWILDHFPYFRNAPTGWKNSVRHNLSLNKCFQKVEKAPNLGKGSLWTVDPKYKPNLIQALTRSPFHPCSTLDPSAYITNNVNKAAVPEGKGVHRMPNPELFPYLARKLTCIAKSENSDESLDDVDAAAVMLSLKNGRSFTAKREKSWQVITTSPSEDHTYSAADSVKIKEEESDDERFPRSRTCRKIDFEDEEERRIKEGAETLLNLAGIATRKRLYSETDQSEVKRFKRSPTYDINDNESPEKQTPFKPRLLRTKKKQNSPKIVFNNNEDEWVKHRRELEIGQPAR